MTHASVFSGIGGPEVAATMLGWQNLFHCEINPFGRQVLDYWYPEAESYEDITTTDFTKWRGRIDVLTGGFPCQPFSYAGQRRGATDDRYLWPYMFRCIDQIRPAWVVAENVAGILTMVEQGEVSNVASAPTLFDEGDAVRGQYRLRETFTLQRICDDLEGHGYSVQPVLIPACGVEAPHRRDRVFIIGRILDDVAHPDNLRAGDNGRQTGDEGRQAREDRREGIRQAHGTAGTSGTGATSPHAPHPESVGQFDGNREERGAVSGRSYMAQTQRRVDASVGNGEPRPIADGQEQPSERLRPEQPETGRTPQVESGRRGGEDGSISGCGRWKYDDIGEWLPTQSPVHAGNDGLSICMDRVAIPYDIGDKDPFVYWRNEALKAYGNAIVPQVMYEIFRAIEQVENP